MDDTEEFVPELDELSERAEAYVELAIESLQLEPSAKAVPEWHEHSELLNGIIRMSNSLPVRMRMDVPRLVVHFLFPNLSDPQRVLIGELHWLSEDIMQTERQSKWPDSENWDEDKRTKSRQRAEALRGEYEAKKRLVDFEGKLTALQVKLLDSSFGNPDARDRVYWPS